MLPKDPRGPRRRRGPTQYQESADFLDFNSAQPYIFWSSGRWKRSRAGKNLKKFGKWGVETPLIPAPHYETHQSGGPKLCIFVCFSLFPPASARTKSQARARQVFVTSMHHYGATAAIKIQKLQKLRALRARSVIPI